MGQCVAMARPLLLVGSFLSVLVLFAGPLHAQSTASGTGVLNSQAGGAPALPGAAPAVPVAIAIPLAAPVSNATAAASNATAAATAPNATAATLVLPAAASTATASINASNLSPTDTAALTTAATSALRKRLGQTGEPQEASELPGTAIAPDPTPWPPTPAGLPPQAWGPGPAAPVEISGSIHLHYMFDLTPTTDSEGRVTSSCLEAVNRAANYHMRWINIFALLYWYDPTTTFTPQYYCYKPARWVNGCVRMNETSIAMFRNGLANCVSAAVQKGMSVSLTAHLDDSTASSVAKWRNKLLLDPYQPYGGYSFFDIMHKPLAEASRVALAAGRQVYLATTGEMSGTILAYPNSHSRMIDQLKDVATAGNPTWRANMKVGVSTNFNKFCGCEDLWDPWNVTQMPQYEQLKYRFNTSAIAALYEKADFIGVSAYPVLTSPTTFQTDELEWPFWHFARESAYLGVDFKSLLIRHGRKLVVSEYGLGGGCSGDYATVCPNAAQAVKMPYFGTMPTIFGSNYTRELDPWQHPDLRSLINLFYIHTIEWLANGGGPHYWIDKLFLWSIGSWDVMGLNKYSYSVNGTFQLPEVASRIAEHNYKVNNNLIYSDYFKAGQRRPIAVGAKAESG